MTNYVAFLRAINVGGQKLIKMEILRLLFEALGFENVRTYIQSGNVIFADQDGNAEKLAAKIERKIHKALGHEVTVLVRTIAELEAIVLRNPFNRVESGADVMLFVVFLAAEPARDKRLPLLSSTENLEVFQIRDRNAFIVARRKKNGRFGFPNNFVEKQLGVPATTRNWTTVKKIIDFANRQ